MPSSAEYQHIHCFDISNPSHPFQHVILKLSHSLQALLRSIMEEEKSRVIYLDCGVIDVSSPEQMAVALREVASKLPSQLGVQLTRTILSKLVPISKLLATGFQEPRRCRPRGGRLE